MHKLKITTKRDGIYSAYSFDGHWKTFNGLQKFVTEICNCAHVYWIIEKIIVLSKVHVFVNTFILPCSGNLHHLYPSAGLTHILQLSFISSSQTHGWCFFNLSVTARAEEMLWRNASMLELWGLVSNPNWYLW